MDGLLLSYNVYSEDYFKKLQRSLTYLHNHSEFSNIRLLDSINKIEDMILHTHNMGQSGLALTDHECLSGHVRFLQTVQELKKLNKIPENYKAILGNEIYLCDETAMNTQMADGDKVSFYHFVLLAKDEKGHQQLRELSTKAWMRAFNHRGMDRVPTYYTDFDELDSGHLISSTACLGSYFAKSVERLLSAEFDTEKNTIKREICNFLDWGIDTFGRNDFYIEIQPSHDDLQIRYNKMALKIAKAYGLKHLITTDAHYLKKEDREIHKAYLTSADKEGSNREVDAFYSTTYFMDVEELFLHLGYLDTEDIESGILNTKEVLNKINIYTLEKEQEIPTTKLPDEFDYNTVRHLYNHLELGGWRNIKELRDSDNKYEEFLVNQILHGINKSIAEIDYDETFDRVDLECGEIIGASKAKGKVLSSYFTTMQKNIQIIWDEAEAIVGTGRGSAGGYIINYLLGITQVNPLKQSAPMPHWRFISAQRPDYPDIDIDIASHKKDVAFTKVHDYYKSIGSNIARVCTFGTETTKSAMKTACRGLDINSDVAQVLSSLIPVERGTVWSLSDTYYGNEDSGRAPIKEFVKVIDEIKETEGKDLLKIALGIENLVNKRSSHACGIVIVNDEITKTNALMRAPNGEIVTQFSLGDSEWVSNLKYDFLVTRTCSIIQVAVELLVDYGIMEWQGSLKATYDKYIHPDVLKKDEAEMWDILNRGGLMSAFQFDSPVGEQAIKEIQPQNLLEASDANNLMRLMPEEGKESPISIYARNKMEDGRWQQDMREYGLNDAEIKLMEKYLLKSYGVCSTQEDMMLLSMEEKIANFDIVQSNLLRKGVAKKIGAKFEEARSLFYEKGISNNAQKKLLDYVWNVQISMQKGYGFCSIHSILYSYILIQQLNLVHYYPSIYYNTAVLLVESEAIESDNEENENKKKKGTKYGVIASSIGKLQKGGITIQPPDINNSKFGFSPDEPNNQILFGLKGVVGINNDTAHAIIDGKPYSSLVDFYDRLVTTKREVTLTTGAKRMKSYVSDTATISLIKGGAFDAVEGIDRVEIMKQHIVRIHPPKKSMNIRGIDQVIPLGIIPEEHQMAVKIYNFRKFITDNSRFVRISETAKSKKWYRLIGNSDEATDYIMNFFEENFLSELVENKDYEYDEDGYVLVLVGGNAGFTKQYQAKTDGIKKWLNSSDCLDRYNKAKFTEHWKKHADGNISKWEMDSISFYYHDHELEHVDRKKYSIQNFENSKDSNTYTDKERALMPSNTYKKVKYPKYPLFRIVGTVLDKDKTKHTVSLLTPDGVVLVKYYGGAFGHYDKQLSIMHDDGSPKTVVESTWFSKGTKLLLTGYRRNEQFIPKVYRGDASQHSTCLIEEIRDDGTLQLKQKELRYRKENQMSETIIKFIGQPSRKKPQLFPLNGKSFDNGEFAIMNFEVYDAIDGDVETNKYGNISIKGFNFPSDYDVNKQYTILAKLEGIDPKYGKQWVSLMCNESIDLNDIWQQKIFLQAFLTDKQIKNLYETLDDPMKAIEFHDADKLTSVKGIGETTAKKIFQRYEDNKDYSEAYVELSSYGLTPNLIKKLCDVYGSATILVAKIKENPYILANQVKGVGFSTVDEMALNAGIPRLSKVRLEAYITHILNEGAQQGYSWITSGVLVDKIESELDIFPIDKVVEVVNSMKEREILWDGGIGIIALKKFHDLELDIAKELSRIKDSACTMNINGWEDRVKKAEKLNGYEYTEEQKSAIEVVLNNQVSIITGQAGTGKTSTVLGALKALGEVNFAQCSLSGKAAARMEEATGYGASTIHRLLGNVAMTNTFEYCQDNPLNEEVIILDEFSMVGGVLFLNLLQAIPDGAKFIMIGDQNQLPAIGALNIASDLTKSEHIPTGMLTTIHRQASKSAVITESAKISNSQQIVDKDFIGTEIRGELQDLELDIYEGSSKTAGKAIRHFRDKLSKCSDIMEIQIIAPMRERGGSSVYELNTLAQPVYNPSSFHKKEVYQPISSEKGYTLRQGDKVLNTKNNYKMEVAHVNEESSTGYSHRNEDGDVELAEIFNGYTGIIIDIINGELIVNFPLIDKTVFVDKDHWKGEKGIELGYAITSHKGQGSSFQYPICVIDYSHYMMLSREWLYTSLTRSSKYCTLVAENKALRKAISTTSVQNKQTFLIDLLEEIYGKRGLK